jgi:hypothetical protein
MRTLWVAAIVAMASSGGSAQGSKPVVSAPKDVAAPAPSEAVVPTKLEASLLARGTLLVTDYYPLGTEGAVTLQAIVVSDPGREQGHVSGLRIDVAAANGRPDATSVSFVDMDEIGKLGRALSQMVDMAASWKIVDKPYTEVQYATNGGLVIGFSQRDRNQIVFITSGPSGATTAVGDGQALTHFKEMVQAAQTLLQYK